MGEVEAARDTQAPGQIQRPQPDRQSLQVCVCAHTQHTHNHTHTPPTRHDTTARVNQQSGDAAREEEKPEYRRSGWRCTA
jgi:hypothetical protein